MGYRKFSDEQKQMWVKKFLTKGAMSTGAFCRESALSATALYRWVSIYGTANGMKPIMRLPQNWTPEEKYKAVMAFDGLPVDDQGGISTA